MSAPTIEDRIDVAWLDLLVREAWPSRWARATAGRHRSKKRHFLRAQFVGDMRFRRLKTLNPHARCGNCKHAGPAIWSKADHECGFHGGTGGEIALVAASDLCGSWKART